ncbi:ABC transporter permease [Clostridium sp. AF18-27]|uniref:DUF6449 domain-containing protein n=1 Tax=Enterocloster lavalensis TaxID=460384 RepID=UPI000E4FA739|nr:DUF6449 domain-containing protein [Enterocloster lavalensis]RHR57647.1 ABC transporter permease [Clostridium sp. AF18-27]
MTSKSLFFKLLRENVKRRAWAIALAVLGFFFSLPINLALTMENAIKTKFWRYNDYEQLVFAEGVSEAEKLAKILEIKTQIVLDSVKFGNGLIAFLIIVAAVVIGVSSFSYLHNRRKVDFYHSIPVRREILFAVQYMGGFLIVALAYLVNLGILMVVSCAYQVPLSAVLGTAMMGWLLNLLFFLLMYAVVSIAMIMTGNMLVGILGTGVFFFYMPGMITLLVGYCSTFFETIHYYFLTGDGSPFMAAIKWTSPVSAYITAIGWNMGNQLGKHIPALFIILFAAVALALLALELYRKRPSESAGKAMAFKWSMMPIRVLLVFAFGMGGAMFFWLLQSTIVWLVFGAVMGSLISHCVIEIIYNFDFKKLLSHKLQYAGCLACVLLAVMAFRFDWFRYDSYVPDEGKVAEAAVEIRLDSGWANFLEIEPKEDGTLGITYYDGVEILPDHMHITNLAPVLRIAEQGRDEALERREKQMRRFTDHETSAGSSSFIIGYENDGDEGENGRYNTRVSVVYTLKSGRKVYRQYDLYLSRVMDDYSALYDSPEYKDGLYYRVMELQPSDVAKVSYSERNKRVSVSPDGNSGYGDLLAAYQADLAELTTTQRLEENPIGQIWFVNRYESAYAEQQLKLYEQRNAGVKARMYQYELDSSQTWPVYPSFKRTLSALEAHGIQVGDLVPDDEIRSVMLDMSGVMRELGLRELEDEELAARYPVSGDGATLVFEEPENIRLLMDAMVDEECLNFNGLCEAQVAVYVTADTAAPTGRTGGYLQTNKITPEIKALFKGTPLEEYDLTGETADGVTAEADGVTAIEVPIMAESVVVD